MRPPRVFVRPLLHEEAVRLKRLSRRAKHESTRPAVAGEGLVVSFDQMGPVSLAPKSAHFLPLLRAAAGEAAVVDAPVVVVDVAP